MLNERISSKTIAVAWAALALMFLINGCASKGRVELMEGNLNATQEEMRAMNDKTLEAHQSLKNDLAALNQMLDEIAGNLERLSVRMAAIEQVQKQEKDNYEAIRAETKGYVDQLGDYKSDYDKAWTQINTIERDLGESQRQLQKAADANRSAIDTLKIDVDAKHMAVNTKIDRVNTDLTARLDTAHQDLATFRKQAADHFETLKQSYINLGKAVYEIVKLQYTQFQSVTEEYTRTMNQIEAQLPAATLGTFEPRESLLPHEPQ